MWAGCAALASALLAAIGYTWCCVAAKRLDVRGAAYVAQARRIASHVRGFVGSPPGSGLQPAGKRNGTQRCTVFAFGR